VQVVCSSGHRNCCLLESKYKKSYLSSLIFEVSPLLQRSCSEEQGMYISSKWLKKVDREKVVKGTTQEFNKKE